MWKVPGLAQQLLLRYFYRGKFWEFPPDSVHLYKTYLQGNHCKELVFNLPVALVPPNVTMVDLVAALLALT